jgi:hypothetical protein
MPPCTRGLVRPVIFPGTHQMLSHVVRIRGSGRNGNVPGLRCEVRPDTSQRRLFRRRCGSRVRSAAFLSRCAWLCRYCWSLTEDIGGEKRGQSTMDDWRPGSPTDKPGEVDVFSCGRPDLDWSNEKSFSISMRTRTDRTFSKAARERPESKKPTNRNSWAVCLFVVGRAGFEPATNGLKVRCSTS